MIANAVVVGLHSMQPSQHDPLDFPGAGDKILGLDGLHGRKRTRGRYGTESGFDQARAVLHVTADSIAASRCTADTYLHT